MSENGYDWKKENCWKINRAYCFVFYSSNQKTTLSAHGTTSISASTSFGKVNTKYLYLSLRLLSIGMEYITVRLHCIRAKQHMACKKYVFSFTLSKMNKMFSISAQFLLLSRGFQSYCIQITTFITTNISSVPSLNLYQQNIDLVIIIETQLLSSMIYC